MSENVYENTIILKNGTSAPSESTLQKAELGFDTAHDILFIGRDSSSPIPLSPYFSPEAPSQLNVENLLWVDTSDSSGVIPTTMGGTGISAGSINELKQQLGIQSISVSASQTTGQEVGSITIDEITTTLYAASYGEASESAAGLMSATDKKKLNGIAENANNYTYTLPTASSSVLGGVKSGSSVTSTSGLTACPIISGIPYYKDTIYTLPTATSSVLGGVKIGNNIGVSSGTISLSSTNVTNALGYAPLRKTETKTITLSNGSSGSLTFSNNVAAVAVSVYHTVDGNKRTITGIWNNSNSGYTNNFYALYQIASYQTTVTISSKTVSITNATGTSTSYTVTAFFA